MELHLYVSPGGAAARSFLASEELVQMPMKSWKTADSGEAFGGRGLFFLFS
jgi:hypothetical protein